MSDLVEFLRGPATLVALITIGVALLGAETWLLAIGTPVLLVAALLALTGFTVFMLVQALWEDYR